MTRFAAFVLLLGLTTACSDTSIFLATRRFTESGTIATRFSPGSVSLSTAILMGPQCRSVATADATQQQGALDQDVPGGGPAAAAGLRSGDVVTAIDGTSVQGTNDLVSATVVPRTGISASEQRP